MKKKHILLFALAALIGSNAAVAQNTTGQLKATTLTATGKLGTSSSKNIDFISNNKTRMTLTSSGNLNINSDQTSIQFPVPGSTPKPMLFMFPSGLQNNTKMVIAHLPDFADYGLKHNDNDDRFDFVSGGKSVFNVTFANGNSSLTAIAVKAIQEQQAMIEELKKEVANLKKANATTAAATNNITGKTAANLSVAYLKQNTPNPFNAATTVEYFVTQITSNAVIEIVSANGQLLKTFSIVQTGKGKITIDATAFSSGTYSCVLKVNGIKADLKQMVLVK